MLTFAIVGAIFVTLFLAALCSGNGRATYE
jgi:hypothetical protein